MDKVVDEYEGLLISKCEILVTSDYLDNVRKRKESNSKLMGKYQSWSLIHLNPHSFVFHNDESE